MFNWIKKVFNKDGVGSSMWFIGIYSHDDDTDYTFNNILKIGLGHYIKTIRLPFSLIKPIVDYQIHMKDINDNDMDDIMATAYAIKEYSIGLIPVDGYMFFRWSFTDDLYKNINNHKGYEYLWYLMFWKSTTKMKTMLLNLDSTIFSDITDSNEDSIKDLEQMQPRYYINISKGDITYSADYRFTLEVYTYGSNLFTKLIMSIFKKPITIRRVYIDIPDKHYNASLSLDDDESTLDVVKRFCRLHRYKYLGMIEKG